MPILSAAPALPPGKSYHVYLSYVWGDGGMPMAVAIKSQLLLHCKGLSVFQDIDDLEEIGDLEGYVRRGCVFVCLLTPAYFASRNCVRELGAILKSGQPLVLLDGRLQPDADKSSLRDACPPELAAVFDGRQVHTPSWIWAAGREFMLKRVLDEVLAACGQPRRLTVPARHSLVRPVTLYASPHNPGAAAFVEEMRAGLHPSSPPLTLATAAGAFQKMVLYLNQETFAGEAGAALASEVGAALDAKTPPLLLHEDLARRFFDGGRHSRRRCLHRTCALPDRLDRRHPTSSSRHP